MRKNFVIFFLVFLLIYISLNAYVILRLGGLLKITKNISYLPIALLTFSLPVAIYAENNYPTTLSRILYTASALWMGILLFTFSLLLLYEAISPFVTIPHAGIILVITVCALSILSIVNATQLSVKEIEVPIKHLKKDTTIVQLSDLHIGTIRNSDFLKKIVKKINQLDPDMILITGDMIDTSTRLPTTIFSVFNTVRAPIYYVTGNHEVYDGKNAIYALLHTTKIKALKNEIVEFEDIQIIGIEFSEDKSHLARELKKMNLDRTKPAVLMYHTPHGMEDAKKAGIDLQLAGHTHFGQIVPFNFLVRLAFKHVKGLYDLESMFLHVSPGTGTWGPYMRLGSKNEISLLKLKTKTLSKIPQ